MLSKSVVDTLHYSVFGEVVRFELLNLEIMHKCTFTIMDLVQVRRGIRFEQFYLVLKKTVKNQNPQKNHEFQSICK